MFLTAKRLRFTVKPLIQNTRQYLALSIRNTTTSNLKTFEQYTTEIIGKDLIMDLMLNTQKNTVLYVIGDTRPHTHTTITAADHERYTREMIVRKENQYYYDIARDISLRPHLPFKRLQTFTKTVTYINHKKAMNELRTLNNYLALAIPTQIKAHYNYLRRSGATTTNTIIQPRIHSP